jgi:hypothetical protein
MNAPSRFKEVGSGSFWMRNTGDNITFALVLLSFYLVYFLFSSKINCSKMFREMFKKKAFSFGLAFDTLWNVYINFAVASFL